MLKEKAKKNLNASGKKPDALVSVALNGSPRQSESDPYTIFFDGGQEITNGTVQKDGSFYDIPSLDVENYNGKIYSDHNYGWKDVLGWAVGLMKDPVENRVTIAGIRFSRKNPLAELARDMVLEGIVEFSIGTMGMTEEDGNRPNHRLFDISIVGLGNNDYTLMENSLLKVAATNGIDLGKYNLNVKEKETMKFLVKNNNSFAAKFAYKNEAGEDVEVEVKPGEEVEVPTQEIQEDAQQQVDEAVEPKTDEEIAAEKEAAEKKAAEEAANGFVTKEDFEKVQNSLNTLIKNMNTPVKPDAGSHADDTKIGKETNAVKDKIAKMTAGQRLYNAIMLERNGMKNSDEYRAYNDFNKEELISKNVMTDDEGSVGGLIPPYELLNKIAQASTNYDGFLNVFGFQDAGLSYGWNMGIGDIEFAPIGYCDPSNQSEFETALQNRTQERLATHTVICNKVSRFSPLNVVNIVAARYQTAYKKALAMFAIAEFQVAVDARVTGLDRATGTDIAPDANGSLVYPASVQKDQASKVLQLFTDLADSVMGGVYVMNAKTAAKLIMDFNLGATGILSNGGTVAVNNYDRLGVALGGTVLVVPNTVLPTLGTNETVTVPRTTEGGGTVVVDHAIFYVEPSNWYGVTNGALQFDVDSFGSYETVVTKTVGEATVQVVETHSAKQRGETVLFGEMYRGGGILDFRQVGGVKASLVDDES